MSISKRLLGMVLGAGVAGVANAAAAQDITFDQVDLIVPYKEGGGSTIHARLYAPALEQALPGNPTILIRNIPGAGSVKGINEFHHTAKPDGSTIASLGTGTFFQYLLEDPAVDYPLPEFNAFLTSPFGLVVYGRKDQGLTGDSIADIEHLIENPPVYGGANATSSDLPALLSIDLLGIKPNYVFGLSNAEAQAGFDRGELTLNYDNMASWAKSVKPMVDEGIAEPLYTFGFENENGEIVRDPMLPDLPTFLEVYEEIHGEPLSGMAYDVWKTLFDIRVMGSKMFALPVGTPQEIIDVYVEAMRDALESDQLTSEQARQILGEYPQSVGEKAQQTLEGATSMDAKQKQWLKDWLHDVHGVG